LTVFGDTWDLTGALVSPDREGLARLFTRFDLRPFLRDKRRLRAFLPGPLKKGMTRRSDAVSCVNVLVADIDHGPAFDDGLALFAPYPRFGYTTWSHTEQDHRFRVAVLLQSGVPPEHWGRCWDWAQNRAGGCLDPSCRGVGRIYYLPALARPDSPHISASADLDKPLLDILAESGTTASLGEGDGSGHFGRSRSPVKGLGPISKGAEVDSTDTSGLFNARVNIDDHGWTGGFQRLDHPEARLQVAATLGAELRGEGARLRADRIRCPSCGRRRVWFWIYPERMRSAACGGSGGGSGSGCGRWFLDQLMELVGGRHG